MFDNHIYTHGETPYVYRKPQKAKKKIEKNSFITITYPLVN